jgi:acetylornithine deacetylase/succinyl-diaminopimelate desuccinylase-like protein
MVADVRERQFVPATAMAADVMGAIEDAARGSGQPHLTMHSGAAHDTMFVASRVPAGMIFVPCKDGLSHVPEEDADPADAAVGAEVMVNAIGALTGR